MPLFKNQTSAYTPLAWVTFELEQGPVTVQTPAGSSTVLPGTASLLSVQTQKSLAQPEGKFQLTLTATGIINEQQQSWLSMLRPNDRAVIRLARKALSAGSLPDADHVVMVGLIDRVAETRGVDPQTGRPVMVATVTGSDFTKLLRQARVSRDIYLGQLNQALFLAQLNDIETKLKDAEQIITILKWFASHGLMDLHFATTGGQILIYFSPDGETHAPLRSVFDIADSRHLTHQGDLWSLLQLIANDPFCELYLDTIGNQPTLVFRPTPFGPPGPLPNWPAFRALQRHTLTKRHYWSTRSLQRSDAELSNVFAVYSQAFALPIDILPVIVKESLRLYGLRYHNKYVTILPNFAADLRQQDIAANGTDRDKHRNDQELKAAQETAEHNSRLSTVLAEWFGHKSQFEAGAKQPLFKSGVLPITFSPEIRIGQAAEFPDLNEIYYIEGVTHRVEVKRSAQTALTLTRGQQL